jgi:hypothetical protein
VSPCGAGSYNLREALGESGLSQHAGQTIGSVYIRVTTDRKTKQHTERICGSKDKKGARNNQILTGTCT